MTAQKLFQAVRTAADHASRLCEEDRMRVGGSVKVFCKHGC